MLRILQYDCLLLGLADHAKDGFQLQSNGQIVPLIYLVCNICRVPNNFNRIIAVLFPVEECSGLQPLLGPWEPFSPDHLYSCTSDELYCPPFCLCMKCTAVVDIDILGLFALADVSIVHGM